MEPNVGYGYAPYGSSPYGGGFMEHEWELRSADDEVLIGFGVLPTGYQTRHAPDLGARGLRPGDYPLPREDGLGFDRDFTDGQTITFEFNVLTDDDYQAHVDRLDSIRAAWHHEAFRHDPQAHGVLTCMTAGRLRRCYGRPRRFAETDADLTHHGFTGVVCDFVTRDGKFYDDAEQVESVALLPPTFFGITDPLTDPIETPQPTERPGTVDIAGQATWVTVTFHGPVTDPSIDFGDFTVALKGTVPAGDSVTVDPRPWSRGVRRADGASVPKMLSIQTPPMRSLKAKPGRYQVQFRGTDNTGTAWAEIRWRNAHDRP